MTQEVTTKATFPSVEWFNAVRDLLSDDPEYRHIGTCDAIVGIKVTGADKHYVLTFEAFEIDEVEETSEAKAEEVDFWLEMSLDGWKDMIQNIKEHGKADLDHTLNTIDVKDPDGLARSHDGYRRDAFFRFNQTFQYFFDVTAKIDTQF